tara:strand:+ start:1227 stop:2141 length:915 start_codon:yes stop_codon:yes gene_type:complete
MKQIKIKFVDGVESYGIFIKKALESLYQVKESDRPDFLFYGDDGARTHYNYRDCVKIYVPIEDCYPNFGYCHYTMGYLLLDNPRSLRVPFYVLDSKASDIVKNSNEIDELVRIKTNFCAFLVSNGNPRRTRKRIQFFEKLNRYKQIDSGGKFKNNLGKIIPPLETINFLRSYKFFITFENHEAPYYASEKIINAMKARATAIYWGDPKIGEDFNSRSFVNLYDYASEEEAIEHIIELDQNEALYREKLAEPYFHNNVPNKYYDEARLKAFLTRVVEDPRPRLDRFHVRHLLYEYSKKIRPYLNR